MTYEEVKRLLHPDTTRDAIWEIPDRDEAIRKIEEACLTACNLIDELQEYKELGEKVEVIGAVEKQKKERPIAVLGIYGGRAYECKDCGTPVSYSDAYCRWCGKKQDWSKEV